MKEREKRSMSQKEVKEEKCGEFDDLISALRTGDVFHDEVRQFKGRRRPNTDKPIRTKGKDFVDNRERVHNQQVHTRI